MRIEGIRTLAGPNVYTHRPALILTLDLEDLARRETRDVEGFNERLLALLPGLDDHHCSRGHAGGFVERLGEGTYFGHTVEHVAIELTGLAGIGVTHGKTRAADREGVYHVVVEYKAEDATRYLLETAVALVAALVKGEEFSLGERIAEAKRITARTELGPSTRAIVDAAARRGIPWTRVGKGSVVQLGWGKHRRFIQAATTDMSSAVAVETSCDKDLTKLLLEQSSVPVPAGLTVKTEDEAVAALETLGAPVVVKPLDGRQGHGVSLNLSTAEEVRAAFRIAADYSHEVLVEELIRGRNYRVLVVGGEVVAASERLPCHVKGDGTHSVADLVEIANRDPLRGDGHEKPLTKIVVDEIALAHLRKNGLTPAHVPEEGETVTLRDSINLSTGGVARDVTDEVHESVKLLCERAARAVGLDICGVDLVLEDISAPFEKGRGVVIELNASPGLRMHHFPSEGRPRDVGSKIVSMLFPAGDGRVPVVSVTGTNGKTSVTRMTGHVLASEGLCVGVTTTDGIWVGGRQIAKGDTTGPHSARTVLSDPTVEAAVLETARGGIVRRGLGYDWSDVGVLTNIQEDHFGQDGIETLEDLVYIKSLVAERVREGGTLVLNADDEILSRLAEEPRLRAGEKRVVYFSMRGADHVVVRKHLDAGGTAFFARDGWVVEATGHEQTRVLRLADVPVTLNGTAGFQSANVLACVAACRARGVAPERIAASLATFQSAADNPGRTNLLRTAAGGYLILDYGHNPEAFAAVCRTASRWRGRRVTGIVGVPGDRSDELIERAGRIAARGFERIVIKEDEDTRGRRRGEVAEILRRAVGNETPWRECSVALSEPEALREELHRQQPGDVLVLFYDKTEPLRPVLEEFGAEPVAAIEGLEAVEEPLAAAASAYVSHAGDDAAPAAGRADVRRREVSQEWRGYIWR
ncbi:MAG TPA: cyanophycin synthetase [Pyrinomonadaceae bacterium]|jgi:cyanophycin synthetase|nr:cyanophycin synthetase [Pyrinomonadaceae bacterium]